jgi:hypothetical protein
MSHHPSAPPPPPCSISITAMNSKQGWALSRSDGGPNIECAQMRYSPVVVTDDAEHETDAMVQMGGRRRCINYPQTHYTGFETCQMCNSTIGVGGGGRDTTTRQAAYKRKNICQACRSHKQAFLHLPTRWVFKYCHGCSRFENIAFFSSPSAGSCEERQRQKALWARQRRTRAKKATAAVMVAPPLVAVPGR